MSKTHYASIRRQLFRLSCDVFSGFCAKDRFGRFAVASLADVACVILSEGVTLEEDIAKTASDKGINVLVSASPSYETAIGISEKI